MSLYKNLVLHCLCERNLIGSVIIALFICRAQKPLSKRLSDFSLIEDVGITGKCMKFMVDY